MPRNQTLVTLLSALAPAEGTQLADLPGLHFYRSSTPSLFRKAPVFGPHLVVVAQGRKRAKFPHYELEYDEDNYLVVTGGTHIEGVVLAASPERPYLAACLMLPPDSVARTLLALTDAATSSDAKPENDASFDETSEPPAFVSPLDDAVGSGMERLLRTLRDPMERQVVAPLVIDELVFRLLRSDAARFVRGAVRQGDANIQEAMRYMRKHATRALSVEQVARHVGMSDSHFAHRFSAVARISPMRFLKQVRLESARELMLGQRLRISEAALAVGYESASHFTRDFKTAFGASPAEYVRRAREG